MVAKRGEDKERKSPANSIITFHKVRDTELPLMATAGPPAAPAQAREPLRGEVRWEWPHSVPPVDALRYSITFRIS